MFTAGLYFVFCLSHSLISLLKMVLSNQDSVAITIYGWCVSMHVASDSRLALMLL